MLRALGISRSFGGQVVLDGVSLAVDGRDRVGVVGPNGAGKTTLLRILSGADAPDAGRVERAPRLLTVGYLPQEPDATVGESVLDYLARRTGVAAASDELDRCTAELSEESASHEAYADALDRFVALGGGDLEARAGSVLAGVGFGSSRLDQPTTTLSGGEAARLALAAILLSRVDVLLLDEPTNNLDFAGLDLLEAFVDGFAGAVVVVSHDRAFLDRAVDRIAELDDHAHHLREFAGGWTEYTAARDLARSQQYEAHERYVSERDRLRERQRTQQQWSDKGVRAAKASSEPDKALKAAWRSRSEKQAGKIKATERKLDQLEAVDKPWEGWRLQLALTPAARSGQVVARLDAAVVEVAGSEDPESDAAGPGDAAGFRLGPVDLEVAWQDRLALLGPNGSGKSTLLRAILGELPLAAGRRWVGPGVQIGSMDQGRERFSGDDPVLATLQDATAMGTSEARSLLAKFGLGADHVDRAGRDLSPGERTRAVLATLMAEGVNCLVLDEPTNHLDVEAIEQLESALSSFEGTLLLVSHDRRFLEAVAVTRTVDVGELGSAATAPAGG